MVAVKSQPTLWKIHEEIQARLLFNLCETSISCRMVENIV